MHDVYKAALTALAEEGLVPASTVGRPFCVDQRTTTADVLDLTPWFLDAWSREPSVHEGDSKRSFSSRSIRQWIARQQERGARLTWSLPGLAGQRLGGWLGERLVWWPRGIPSFEFVSIVSSRLSQPIDGQYAWFAMLRRICHRLDADRQMLLTSPKMATHDFLMRCAELYGLKLLRLDFGARNHTWRSWLRTCVSRWNRLYQEPPWLWPAIVSPPRSRDRQLDFPERDAAIVAAADRLVALRVRSEGNIARLLEQRLKENNVVPQRLVLAVGQQLTTESTARSFRSLGASLVAGPPMSSLETDQRQRLAEEPPAGRSRVPVAARIIQCDSCGDRSELPVIADPDDFLTHCTRRRRGPWPDETQEQYLEHLILGCEQADHSASATLRRILASEVLRATPATTRGKNVISFTAVPFQKIPQLHRYRAHRCRWDFEPYGICIRRDWLVERGAKAVHYVDAADWEAVSRDERWFAQRRTSGKRNPIDWSVECEWRLPDDLDLHVIPSEAAWVFVPGRADAEKIKRVSRWPILVVGSGWKWMTDRGGALE